MCKPNLAENLPITTLLHRTDKLLATSKSKANDVILQSPSLIIQGQHFSISKFSLVIKENRF